jgi:23S rRNA (uracil1939-C5)-methyltransferase
LALIIKRQLELMQQKLSRDPVVLEEIHSSGRCICSAGDKKVYLERGIPGETVSYTLERSKLGFRAGKVETILQASPHRVKPFCLHYADCGGCPWQHIDYQHQLALKHRILSNALEKYGVNTPVIPPVIMSPAIRHFRHRMEYAFSAHGLRNTGPALGFHPPREPWKVVNIDTCQLQADPSRAICDFIKAFSLEKKLPFYNHQNKSGLLRSLSLRVNMAGEIMVLVGFNERQPEKEKKVLSGLLKEFPGITSLCSTVHLSPSNNQLQGEIIPFGNMQPYLTETLDGLLFRMHATSFFQPNVQQATQIFETARKWAGLTGKEKVYDLYCGVGTLSLFLSGADAVTGIEGSAQAVLDANANARINNIRNVKFITGDILKTFTPGFLEKRGRPEVVVLDPPRSGTLIEIKKTIMASRAKKVIYLSCNPVSLAYDLSQLYGVYHVTSIQPFDMLPHTHHLETLVLLEK